MRRAIYWTNPRLDPDVDESEYSTTYGYANGGFLPYFKISGEQTIFYPEEDRRITKEDLKSMSDSELSQFAKSLGITMEFDRRSLIKAIRYELENNTDPITHTELVQNVIDGVNAVDVGVAYAKPLPMKNRDTYAIDITIAYMVSDMPPSPQSKILAIGDVKPFAEFFEERLKADSTSTHLYQIEDTEQNRNIVRRFMTSLKDVVNANKGSRIYLARNKPYGIVGFETPFVEPRWLKDAVRGEWIRMFNPRRGSKGILTFTHCSVSISTLELAIRRARGVKVGDEYPFNKISDRIIVFRGRQGEQNLPWVASNISRMDEPISIVAWDNHAMVAHKEQENLIFLYDPWIQDHNVRPSFREVKKVLREDYNIDFVFRSRMPEQAHEGTCMLVSFSRALALSAGLDPMYPIPDEIVVLAYRLVLGTEKRFV